MTADELKLRTKQFALRVIKLVAALPKTIEGRAIANQLVRCGTSVAANYRATCRARSRVNSLPKWVWFLRRQMKLSYGSN
jgi:four helix bundle protein